MIGNDIIDLTLAQRQSNWRRKGFLDKIFTKKEQETITNAGNPFQMVWLLWSMKESAYKIYNQKFQRRFYAPKRCSCKLVSATQGEVEINQEKYVTNSQISDRYIFTEATTTSNQFITSNYFRISNEESSAQSVTIYHKILHAISEKSNIPLNRLDIQKNKAGIPQLFYKDQLLQIPFSLSHHGNYGAYSFLNTPT